MPWAWVSGSLAAIAAAGLAWSWFEAGWLRTRTVELPLEQLPDALDGLRVVHLSDFHLGRPSRGAAATEAAVAWTVARRPDLVCITGDLLSHRRGEGRLRLLVERLRGAYVVLGNHDVASTRDPFSRAAELDALSGAMLLRDEAVIVELRGERVQIAGVDPRSYALEVAPAGKLVDRSASLRILLCHFPGIVRTLSPGAFDLVLAGHLHAGQITVPYPGGRLKLAHPRTHEAEGVYRYDQTTLHVSPGLGTSLVPFRFFARPEATELVLRRRAEARAAPALPWTDGHTRRRSHPGNARDGARGLP